MMPGAGNRRRKSPWSSKHLGAVIALGMIFFLFPPAVGPVFGQGPDISLPEEKADLQKKIALLESRLAEEEAALAVLTARFGELRGVEAEVRDELAEAYTHIGNIEANIRPAAKETADLLESSLVSPLKPSRFDLISPLLDPERMPGFEEFRNLVHVLFDEMEATGRIEVAEGPYIDLSGQSVGGPVLRVGGLASFFRRGEKIGFLRPLDDGRKQLALPVHPSWGMKRALNRYFDGQGDALPLDLSDGAAFEHLGAGRDFRDWLGAGGFLVWPIIVLGAVAVVLILERLVFLGRLRSNTDAVFDRITRLAGQGEWEACRKLCRDGKAPACRVMAAGLDHRQGTPEALDNAVQESIMKQMPALERYLPTLSVLAAIAPLLGLLGTVTGMIDTFQVITVFGSGDPRLMAGGISEALITTQLGLAVALPIMMIHHYLERRVDRIVDDMEEKGMALLGVMPLHPGER